MPRCACSPSSASVIWKSSPSSIRRATLRMTLIVDDQARFHSSSPRLARPADVPPCALSSIVMLILFRRHACRAGRERGRHRAPRAAGLRAGERRRTRRRARASRLIGLGSRSLGELEHFADRSTSRPNVSPRRSMPIAIAERRLRAGSARAAGACRSRSRCGRADSSTPAISAPASGTRRDPRRLEHVLHARDRQAEHLSGDGESDELGEVCIVVHRRLPTARSRRPASLQFVP